MIRNFDIRSFIVNLIPEPPIPNLMAEKRYFIIDFDSTFTQVEALDELCEISLRGQPDKPQVLQSIKETTDLAMEGELSFRESLERRIGLLRAKREHLPELIERLRKKVSKSIDRNKEFFSQYSENVHIISNGFSD